MSMRKLERRLKCMPRKNLTPKPRWNLSWRTRSRLRNKGDLIWKTNWRMRHRQSSRSKRNSRLSRRLRSRSLRETRPRLTPSIKLRSSWKQSSKSTKKWMNSSTKRSKIEWIWNRISSMSRKPRSPPSSNWIKKRKLRNRFKVNLIRRLRIIRLPRLPLRRSWMHPTKRASTNF